MSLAETTFKTPLLAVLLALLVGCGAGDDTENSTNSSSTSSSSSSSSSSGLSPHPEAVTVEAEDYSAWKDSDTGNQGNAYRQDDVDIEESGTGFQVTKVAKGEWLEYQVEIPKSGTYELWLLHSSAADPVAFSLLVDGENRVQAQSDNSSSRTAVPLRHLSAGNKVLRLYFSGAAAPDFQFDKLMLNPIALGEAPKVETTTYPAGDAASGSALYAQQCAFCHGGEGQGNEALKSPALIGCATCDNYQGLANHIADAMPPANPSNCESQCAADIAAFLRQDINKPFDVAACTNSLDQNVTPDELKRLSYKEYTQTISDLLAIPSTETFAELPTDTRKHNFNTYAYQQNISTNYMRAYLAIAERQAKAMMDDPNRRDKVVGCDINQQSCYNQFLGRFGRLAYRRPVTSIEWRQIQELVKLHARNNADKFIYTAQLFLTSPHFLYRAEIGGDWQECGTEGQTCTVSDWSKVRYGANGYYAYTRGNQDVQCSFAVFGDPLVGTNKKCWISPMTNPLKLDENELASRLAFSLWGRGPDLALLNKARDGQLDTAEGRRQVIQEMLLDDRAKAHFADFFDQWLAMFKLTEPEDKPANWYDGAIADMKNETQTLLAEYAWGGENFLEVLTANHTYLTDKLANYYGLAGEGGKVTFSEGDPRAHAGILTHGANMFAKTDGDLISIRGNWFRDTFLCKDIVIPTGVQDLIAGKFAGYTPLEIITARNEEPACRGCHAKIDPIGIALASFDGTGLFDYDLDLTQFPVTPGLPDLGQAKVNSAKDLAFYLKHMPEVSQCITKRLFLYTRFKEPSPQDLCTIEQMASEFEASNFDLESLIMSLVSDEGFAHRKLARP